MKDMFLESIKQVSKERRIIIAFSIFLLLSVIFLFYIAFNIHPSDLKVVSHYTAFGATNFYRDTWYYLLNFAAFVVFLVIVHAFLTLKLLAIKGRDIALAFVWMSVVILLIAAALVYQILKVAALA